MRRNILSRILLAGLALGAGSASAAEYFIADGHAEALAGAMRDANASPEADTIHLAAGGHYRFAQASEDGFLLPPVRGRLTLRGQGAELQRDAALPLAWLEVTADAELDLDTVTLVGAGKGSVRNHGTLRASHSTILAETTKDTDVLQNFGQLSQVDLRVGAIASVTKSDSSRLEP